MVIENKRYEYGNWGYNLIRHQKFINKNST